MLVMYLWKILEAIGIPQEASRAEFPVPPKLLRAIKSRDKHCTTPDGVFRPLVESSRHESTDHTVRLYTILEIMTIN